MCVPATAGVTLANKIISRSLNTSVCRTPGTKFVLQNEKQITITHADNTGACTRYNAINGEELLMAM